MVSMMIGNTSVRCRWFGFILLTQFMSGALAAVGSARIDVSVDHDDLRVGESFVLTFDAEGLDGQPDFSPLDQDFEILGSSQRRNLIVNDGRFSKSVTWQLNLMPRRSGELLIPAIAFGKEASTPLAITVAPVRSASAADEETALRLEVSATPQRPYVQAQVLLSVRLVVPEAVDLVETAFSDPHTSGGDVLVSALGKPRESMVTDGGRRYRVIERLYALFPQQQGALTLDPITFEGQIFEGSASLLNPFSQAVRTHRLESEPIPLEVRPVPAAFQGRHWLPAASLSFNETWSDEGNVVQAGEPATRSLSLLARGVTAGQLPEISPPPPAGIKSYPETPVLDDQARSDGLSGLRMEKIALIANTNGTYTLPEIRIPWWNTVSDRAEQAVIPARSLVVEGGSAPADAIQPTPAPAPTPAATPAAVDGLRQPAQVWKLIAALLALGWALTVMLWWRSERQPQRPAQPAADNRKLVDLEHAVLKHSREHAAAATRAALLVWAQASGIRPATLEEIARRCPSLAEPMATLNRSLYADTTAAWNGGTLAAAFPETARARRTRADSAGTVPSSLAPLYLPAASKPAV